MPNWKKLVTSGSDAAIPSVSPAGDFTIDAGSNINLDADGAVIKLKDAGTEFGRLSRVSSDLVVKSSGNNNDIVFKGVDDSSTITAMTIDMSEGGRVGIGETSPSTTLHVANSGNHGIIRIAGDTNKDATLQLYSDRLWVIQNDGDGSLGTADTLHIYDNTAGASRIAIDTSGNVGLGTTSPSVKLEVAGAISGSALVSKQKHGTITGANNVDLSTSANHNLTLSGNVTLTPTNFSGRRGQSGIITLIQDSSGGHSITLNSLFKTPRGDSIAFDTTADGISLMSYYVIDASNVAVNYLGPFS